MDALIRFNRKSRKILLSFSTMILFVFVFVVLLQVFARNFLKIAIDWTSEVSLLCFVWSVFLGSACAITSRSHYVVDLFPPEYVKTNMVLIVIADILVMGVIFVMLFGGTKFVVLGMKRLSTSLEIPRFWLYVSMPLSGFFMLLYNFENLVADAKSLLSEFRGV